MTFFRLTLITLLALLLNACAFLNHQPTTPAPLSVTSIQSWTAKGRVGIRTEQDAVSGNFNWEHNPNTFDLRMYGPFGQGSTELSKDKTGKIVLTYDDQKAEGYDAAALLKARLGWEFPVRQVSYWIRGLAYPNSPRTITRQVKSNLPSKIVQDGWTITYERYSDVRGLSLPQKMQVSRPPYRVSLIINQWDIQ